MKKLIFCTLLIFVISIFGEVSLTVYNDDLGLVKDTRELDMDKGIFDLAFPNVSSRVISESVHFRCIDKPDEVAILEQNYRYDLFSTEKLLEKFLDKEISVTMNSGDLFSGTLLSSRDGSILLEGDGNLVSYRIAEIQNINFNSKPENLLTKPALIWKLNSKTRGDQLCEVSYLTTGMSWHADYVATVNKDDTGLILDGWVTLLNNTGTGYENANIKLVAGDVNRIQHQPMPRGGMNKQILYAAVEDAEEQFTEESFFEYHLYTLGRKSTLLNNEEKQLTLFPSAELPVEKKYTFDIHKSNKVQVTLEFDNKEEDGLGIPLPKGDVRVYKKDSKQEIQFIGEDRIDHTPKDEKVRLLIGNAFDITAKRESTGYKRLSDKAAEESFQVVLKNHKDEDIEVIVVDHFWGDWYIKNTNVEPQKTTSRIAEFPVRIKADGEYTLTYTVRYKY